MINQIGIENVWLVAKVAVLIFLLLYIIFAVVLVKQVRLMIDTLEVGLEKTLRTISIVHLVIAIAVFLFSLLVL